MISRGVCVDVGQENRLMEELNYYEAPRSDEVELSVGQPYAKLLLETREKPMSLGFYYRLQLKGYTALAIFFGVPIIMLSWLGLDQLAVMMGLMFGGYVIRDFQVARAQVRMWPLQVQLLDWGKVERLAAGESIGSG